jgi:hypothetical protein
LHFFSVLHFGSVSGSKGPQVYGWTLVSSLIQIVDIEMELITILGSVHFAPLAGRILLKDVRYHSSNQTVKIVKAQILWRYWIRRPTTEEDLSHARVGGEDRAHDLLLRLITNNTAIADRHSNRSQACRIQVSFQGFEWFMYNRTAAYDNIAAAMDPNGTGARSDSRRRSEDTGESRRTTTKSSGIEGPFKRHLFSTILVLKSLPYSIFDISSLFRGSSGQITTIYSNSAYMAQTSTTPPRPQRPAPNRHRSNEGSDCLWQWLYSQSACGRVLAGPRDLWDCPG